MQVFHAADVHFLHDSFRAVFQLNCVDTYSIQQSDIGSHADADGADLYGFICPDGAGTKHGLFEDDTIHDITANDRSAHPDAIASYGIDGLTIRSSRFYRNACINYRGDAADRGTIVFENNFFSDTIPYAGGLDCGQNVQIHGDGAKVDYNTIQGNVQALGAGEGDNQYWVGNIVTGVVGNYDGCPGTTGSKAEYNVWSDSNDSNCGLGATNVRASAGTLNSMFVSTSAAAGSDLHLKTGALAIDKGDRASYPAVDFDGQSRPAGAGPDAGADELR